MRRFLLGVLAYAVPTFVLAFVWHLILFKAYYEALAIYRPDVIIPFGILSMLIQATIFAWIYEKIFARQHGPLLQRILAYAALGAVLSWSFSTLAVGAKNIMASVPSFILIETGFTIVQWAIVGPLTAFALGESARQEATHGRAS